VAYPTYADFLRLPELLDKVVPRTPPRRRRVHAAEHFFLVAHQTSELWLKQVLLDVAEATDAAAAQDLEQAAQYVERAADALHLLAAHVTILRRLQPADFAEFRPGFGDASGAQSAQFHALRAELGMDGSPSPLYRELLAALARQPTTLEDIYRRAPHGGALHRLAEAMAELSQAAWRWQLDHLETVNRVIGGERGTGGTSGAEHLAARLTAPFPELWAARARLHRSDGGAQCPL